MFHIPAVVEAVAVLGHVDHAPEAAAQSLELGAGARAAHLGESGLVLGCGDAGEGADLRIGEDTAVKAFVQARQSVFEAGWTRTRWRPVLSLNVDCAMACTESVRYTESRGTACWQFRLRDLGCSEVRYHG